MVFLRWKFNVTINSMHYLFNNIYADVCCIWQLNVLCLIPIYEEIHKIILWKYIAGHIANPQNCWGGKRTVSAPVDGYLLEQRWFRSSEFICSSTVLAWSIYRGSGWGNLFRLNTGKETFINAEFMQYSYFW